MLPTAVATHLYPYSLLLPLLPTAIAAHYSLCANVDTQTPIVAQSGPGPAQGLCEGAGVLSCSIAFTEAIPTIRLSIGRHDCTLLLVESYTGVQACQRVGLFVGDAL